MNEFVMSRTIKYWLNLQVSMVTWYLSFEMLKLVLHALYT